MGRTLESGRLIELYKMCQQRVWGAGFKRDWDWCMKLDFEDVDERTFLMETAFVTLTSGMRVQVVEKKWPYVVDAFEGFRSAALIAARADQCVENAMKHFGSKAKLNAIAEQARRVNREEWAYLKPRIRKGGLEVLREFPYIGPITQYHLARNIGLDVAKPDRHLVRISEATGRTVQGLCEEIAKATGERVGAVDVVLFRYASLNPDYLREFGGGTNGG